MACGDSLTSEHVFPLLMLILPPFLFCAVLMAQWLSVGDGCTALRQGVGWHGVGGCGRGVVWAWELLPSHPALVVLQSLRQKAKRGRTVRAAKPEKRELSLETW